MSTLSRTSEEHFPFRKYRRAERIRRADLVRFRCRLVLAPQQLWDAFFDRSGKGVFVLAAENFGKSQKNPFVSQLFPYIMEEGQRAAVEIEVPFQLTESGKIHPLIRLSDDFNQESAALKPPCLHLPATYAPAELPLKQSFWPKFPRMFPTKNPIQLWRFGAIATAK